MAETHHILDSWYEIWYGPDENRRHLKRTDEASMVAEVKELRRADAAAEAVAVEQNKPWEPVAVNIEVTKISVSREQMSESESSWQ